MSFAGGALRRQDLILSGERACTRCGVRRGGVARAVDGAPAARLHAAICRVVHEQQSAAALYAERVLGRAAGSMLFWSLILTTYSAIAVWTNRSRNRVLMPYVSGTLAR